MFVLYIHLDCAMIADVFFFLQLFVSLGLTLHWCKATCTMAKYQLNPSVVQRGNEETSILPAEPLITRWWWLGLAFAITSNMKNDQVFIYHNITPPRLSWDGVKMSCIDFVLLIAVQGWGATCNRVLRHRASSWWSPGLDFEPCPIHLPSWGLNPCHLHSCWHKERHCWKCYVLWGPQDVL